MKLWFGMLRMCVCMHSHFIENHLIWILEDRPLISEVVLPQRPNASRAPSTHISLFLVLETRVVGARPAFCSKGRRASSSASHIDPKVRHTPNRRVSFHLASSSTV
jgi:hypothetical protein